MFNCPKCDGENSMYLAKELKWTKQNKWQNFVRCQLCRYETEAK